MSPPLDGSAADRLPDDSLDVACSRLTEFGYGAPASLLTRFAHAMISGFATLAAWQQRARERHNLAAMDERLRRDIGIGNADTYRELRKPFWIS